MTAEQTCESHCLAYTPTLRPLQRTETNNRFSDSVVLEGRRYHFGPTQHDHDRINKCMRGGKLM